MATIYEISKEHQALIRDLDSVTNALLAANHAQVFNRLQFEIEALTARIEAARASGIEVTRSWFFRQARLEDLLQQISREVGRFAASADLTVLNGQRQAVDIAQNYAGRMVQEGIARQPGQVATTFNRLPSEAMEQLSGFTSDKSPVRALFRTFGPNAAQDAEITLLSSVAEGINPRQTAKALRDDLDVPLERAKTIARTEQLRASNAAAAGTYEANSDVVEGWISTAALDSRVCPVCIALNGTVYKNSEVLLPWHPNCRCAARPKIIGIPDNAMTGVEWFDRQAPDVQEKILGPKKFAAFERGEFTLSELVVPTNHPLWGPGAREKSLAELQVRPAKAA